MYERYYTEFRKYTSVAKRRYIGKAGETYYKFSLARAACRYVMLLKDKVDFFHPLFPPTLVASYTSLQFPSVPSPLFIRSGYRCHRRALIRRTARNSSIY